MPTSVGDANYKGEITQIAVSVPAAPWCMYTDFAACATRLHQRDKTTFPR
jgi:hypothetical protein